MTDLSDWDTFYMIVGPSAGALIGLQFVVMTLIAERPTRRAAEAGAAFASPTIFHFSVILLLAAFLRMPWHSLLPIAVICGLIGCGGFVYEMVIARRMRIQKVYQPRRLDWLFHVWGPLTAYVLLSGSAMMVLPWERDALFGVSMASLLLLFIAIRNAWDSVCYQVIANSAANDAERGSSPSQDSPPDNQPPPPPT
jgi:hypothetical protein